MASAYSQQFRAIADMGQSREPRLDERWLQHSGLASPTHSSGVRQEISHGRSHPWRTFKRRDTGVARFVWNVESHYRRSIITRLLRADAESSWKLRPGRRVHPRQRERFWRRRSARHPRRGRCRDKKTSNRSCASRRDWLELRRLYDDVDRHANKPIPWRCRRCRHCQLAKLLWPELDRSMDDSVLRRIGLRRFRRLPKEFSDSLH